MVFKVTVNRSGEVMIQADSAHEALEKADRLDIDDISWFSAAKTVSAEYVSE